MKLYILSLALVLSSMTLASMIPQNDLYISVDEKNVSNIDKIGFDRAIDKIENNYRAYIESLGVGFTVVRSWDDGTVNARAWKKEGNYYFEMFGGLARYKTMVEDSFTLVACHELGHLIGGAPTWKPFNHASSEGQADYFSTSRCFRKVVAGEDHKKVIGNHRFSPIVLSKCSESFNVETEMYQICLRTALANKAMAETFASLGELDAAPQFDTPDPYERMFILFNGYPNAQCRLDTLFAGSLCDLGEQADQMPDLDLYNKGFCSKFSGHTKGLRPLCWYVPRADEEK